MDNSFVQNKLEGAAESIPPFGTNTLLFALTVSHLEAAHSQHSVGL